MVSEKNWLVKVSKAHVEGGRIITKKKEKFNLTKTEALKYASTSMKTKKGHAVSIMIAKMLIGGR